MPRAIPPEAQVAIRFSEQAPNAIPPEAQDAIPREFRERGEIRHEAQSRPATLASVFLQELCEFQSVPQPLTWMREILREKASFSIRELSETRFVQMDFANRFGKQLFAHPFGKGVFATRSL